MCCWIVVLPYLGVKRELKSMDNTKKRMLKNVKRDRLLKDSGACEIMFVVSQDCSFQSLQMSLVKILGA